MDRDKPDKTYHGISTGEAMIFSPRALISKELHFPNDFENFPEAIMGGSGSGRRWGYDPKPTTTQHFCIDVRHWEREGLLTPGLAFMFKWTRNGGELGAMEVEVEADCVILTYAYRRPREEGDGKVARYPVYLERTPCHLGGERPWFLCPGRGCGRRVAILYTAPTFSCRRCLGLGYWSQREGELDRKQRKLRKVRARLGAHDLAGPIWLKPKGMHQTTFDRLREEERAARRAADLAWVRAAQRILPDLQR
jgi:hypothetical protein